MLDLSPWSSFPGSGASPEHRSWNRREGLDISDRASREGASLPGAGKE